VSEGGKVSVNTDAMNALLAALSHAANQVNGISNNVYNLITEYFGSWGTGNDPTAKQFGAVYVPASGSVANGVKVAEGAVSGAENGVKTMIGGYKNTEDTNTEAASGT
jgi:hypothetical protein